MPKSKGLRTRGLRKGSETVPRKLKGLLVGGPEMAELLQLTQSRVTQLVRVGTLPRESKGFYDVKDTVQAYVRFLREQQKRQQVNTADNRIRDARAKDIEARTAQRLGSLVPLTLFDEMLHGFAGVVRSELSGMPAACTRDLIMRRIIERELNARLHRMAEYAKAASVRVGAVGGPHNSERPNGAGSVGGSEPDLPADGGDSGAT